MPDQSAAALSPAARHAAILEAMLSAIARTGTEWRDVVAAVDALGLVGKGDWLEVRNLLQWLIDHSWVARAPGTQDTYVRLMAGSQAA